MLNFNKNKLKHILILCLIFAALTSLRFLWLTVHKSPIQPLAEQGILNLESYELTKDQTISLNGEWEFIPETLLNPDSDKQESANGEKEIVSVPGKSSKDSSYQFGTYRLRILLNENQPLDDKLGIIIPPIKTASELFINGQSEAKSGQVGENQSEHKGKDISYTTYFSADQDELEILLHISDFDAANSIQLSRSIEFGLAEAIIAEKDYAKNLMYGMVVVLLMHSLYSVLIYVFIYRKKIMLLFSIGFILPALDEVITANKSILNFLSLDYGWSLKISDLIYLGATFFFVQLMRVILANFRDAKIFRWFTFLYGLSALSIVLMPASYLASANMLFFALYFTSFITVFIFSLREYFENPENSIFLAITVLSTTSGILWGSVKVVGMQDIPFYPFDYLIAFLVFGLYWFKRFHQKKIKIVGLVKELEKEDKLKNDFLKDNSEKLWKPLNEIITIAEKVYEGDRSTLVKQDKKDLKFLIDIGRSMSFTLNDLLDFTRLEEQRIHIHPEKMNVQAVIPGIFEMLEYIVDGKPVHMTSKISNHFPNVCADENRLIQILFNLLHNAIKYTSEGFIVIDAEVRGGMAEIHIRDSSLGMDAETKKRVLSPYEQDVKNDNGVELGLNVCKKLIELHGGTLQVESIPNQGSHIVFTLPLAEDQVNVSEETELNLNQNEASHSTSTDQLMLNVDQTSEKRYNILAIDDDPVTLKIISTIFLSKKHKIVTRTSGKKALELLDDREWDLIILDAMMPYMSGYEVTRLIRKRYSILELPILLLTGRNQLEEVYTGFNLGVNDYITKPINSMELKHRGETLINLRHSIKEGLHLEAAWLQAQIQPHFLFNTLNTIASFGITDSERMTNLLEKFGVYLQASFDAGNLQRVVKLENELKLVHSYLYIEQERFGDRLKVQWEVDKDLEVELPPLSIQPLVENAVRHGVLKNKIGGTIQIRITDHPESTRVAIIDDGVGMTEERIAQILNVEYTEITGIGLRNTNRRLIQTYGQGLEVSSAINEGTKVVFEIPKKK